jgi:hypothetical protein
MPAREAKEMAFKSKSDKERQLLELIDDLEAFYSKNIKLPVGETKDFIVKNRKVAN